MDLIEMIDISSEAAGLKKNLLRTFFLLTVSSSAVSAGGQDVPAGMAAGTKMVCESEQSIGFRWIKGNWKSTDFVPGKYIVEKLANAGNGGADCGRLPDRTTIDVERGLAVIYGCFAVKVEVDGQSTEMEHVCRERWQRAEGKWIVADVSCENFRFMPDGWFHRTSLHGDLADNPQDDAKDPLSITVGHCRTL